MRLLLLIFLISCGQNKKLNFDGNGQKTILLTGLSQTESIRKKAQELGLEVSGDSILKIEGDVQALNQLEVEEDALVAIDVPIIRSEEKSFTPTDASLFLAKKDFGLLEFWQKYPEADGRGVTVGVFDDGISAHQSGFLKTTTGERKLLKKGSNSTFTTYQLIANGDLWEGDIVEKRLSVEVDLNGDKKFEGFKVQVSDKVCLDFDVNQVFTTDECRGLFSTTGEYFIVPNTNLSIIAEFNSENGILKLSQPEIISDSHGEGVASVMSSYAQGGLEGMNGVAPGSKIVDYDISESSHILSENDYTMGTILFGLEWLAINGAEVINVSYSLFFSSVKAQNFMAVAIDNLVKKYNVVISFSAGNNGPGLGSLNRKVIYPSSVLVAGAFVSKELDERVWGVSGLPEEGRVVFYSSRGPGPLGDHGPLLISPLSSLTHSSPDEGYRAFSGTSSASPALAGAATVLISAIKQVGLKVDAPTVVHALRLSGKRLIAEPFVAQGYGLPQVEKALTIYKQLIAGQKFMNVNIGTNRNSQDAIAGKGAVFLRSQSQASESVKIEFKGEISKLAPKNTGTDLLVPVKLEYSNGISGSSELWISAALSRVHVEVDLDGMLEQTSGEAFGEVRVLDFATGELMAIVPITVLNDLDVRKHQRVQMSVGSQGSARIHLNAAEGISAYKVKARLISGDTSNIYFSIFDPNRIRVNQIRFTDDFWIVTDKPGHYQLALAMSGGTGKETVVEFDIEPIKVALRTNSHVAATPKITLKNLGTTALLGKIELASSELILARILSDVAPTAEIKPLEATINVKEKGTFSAKMLLNYNSDITYLYANCSGIAKEADGTQKIFFDSFNSPDDLERSLTFRCLPFDHGVVGAHQLAWEMQVIKDMPQEKVNLAISIGEQSTIDFSATSTGSYSVWIEHFSGLYKFKLGEVDLL